MSHLEVDRRCSRDGRGCLEVTARLVAADTAEYVVGLSEPADRLRETARRISELHLDELVLEVDRR